MSKLGGLPEQEWVPVLTVSRRESGAGVQFAYPPPIWKGCRMEQAPVSKTGKRQLRRFESYPFRHSSVGVGARHRVPLSPPGAGSTSARARIKPGQQQGVV